MQAGESNVRNPEEWGSDALAVAVQDTASSWGRLHDMMLVAVTTSKLSCKAA